MRSETGMEWYAKNVKDGNGKQDGKQKAQKLAHDQFNQQCFPLYQTQALNLDAVDSPSLIHWR